MSAGTAFILGYFTGGACFFGSFMLAYWFIKLIIKSNEETCYKIMDSAICRVCGKKFFYERKQGHRRTMCSKECVKEADRAASRDWYHRNFEVFGKRASGKKYKNPPEKLQAIKEKYKNGVTLEILEEWLGG